MKIAVAGAGYVGLVTGVCLACFGHSITCVDIDSGRIEMLKNSRSPIYEPQLEELLCRNADRLTFTCDFASAYRDAEIIFIGVGTPEKQDGSANLSFVYKVAEQIAQSVERDCVVVVKSTVPIGTNDKIEDFIRARLANPVKIYVASNPEFLAQGTAVDDTLHASRIVIGTHDEFARTKLCNLYEPFGAPLLLTNRRSAEMIKYASNDFLALKISYINEIANLCEIVGANIEDVSHGMGLDTRIGNKFLRAGIGYGGSCFPKDTKALSWLASFNDYELKTVKAAIEVNEQQKVRLIRKAHAVLESFEGLTVAVLGLAFKPNTDDLREAASLINVPILLEEGATVRAWDPAAAPAFSKRFPEVTYCSAPSDALKGADLCMIFTEWQAVLTLTPADFEKQMNRPLVFDGRNCFPKEAFAGTKVEYYSIGRPDTDD